mmetsp:Transcript_39655/g.123671  ORF Transcript_39655/g.123671 Transcript_39655/m.123671 type:complete len:234 (-) Transcript_39655:2-703(-)
MTLITNSIPVRPASAKLNTPSPIKTSRAASQTLPLKDTGSLPPLPASRELADGPGTASFASGRSSTSLTTQPPLGSACLAGVPSSTSFTNGPSSRSLASKPMASPSFAAAGPRPMSSGSGPGSGSGPVDACSGYVPASRRSGEAGGLVRTLASEPGASSKAEGADCSPWGLAGAGVAAACSWATMASRARTLGANCSPSSSVTCLASSSIAETSRAEVRMVGAGWPQIGRAHV